MSVRPPDYTLIPNEVLDDMAAMPAGEIMVVIGICRRIFSSDPAPLRITVGELMTATGLSRRAVAAGIDAAVERGIVNRTIFDYQES